MIARTLLACAASLVLCARAAAAQGITVRPLQNLTFGFLLPGVNTRIDPLNLSRSGQIELLAARGTIFEVRMTVPTALAGQGTTLPLAYDAGSAAASALRSPIDAIRFDPRGTARFQLVTADRASIFIGAEARPRVGQPVGSYTAPLVVTITNLSN